MRCRFCGSTMIHSAHDHKNFSTGKAIAGTIVFGPMGAGAGMIGKDTEGFRCTQCGAFMESPMNTMTEKLVNDAVYDAKRGTSYISYNLYKSQYPNIETVQVEDTKKTERIDLHVSDRINTVKAINIEKDVMEVKRSFKMDLWEPSSPVYIRNIQIKTGNNGDALAFDIVNQSEKTLRSLYLQASVLDDTGDEITTIQCVYQGENVEPGKTFSSDKVFSVGSDLAYKVKAVCEKASFTDDSVWRAENETQAYVVALSEIKDYPRFKYVYKEYNKILEGYGIVKKNKRGYYENSCRPKYLPVKNESNGYWTCTCGMPVTIGKTCPVCKCGYEELQKIFSQEYLIKIQHDAVFQRASERASETVEYREKLDKTIEEKKAAEYEKALSARELESIPQLTIAVGLLDELGDYKDAKKMATEYRSHLEELKAEEEKKAAAIAEERAKQAAKEAEILRQQKEKRKKLIIFASVAATAIIAVYIIAINSIIPNNKYNAAVTLMENGEYDSAIEGFEALQGYKDSNSKIEECQARKIYDKAESKVKDGLFAEAYSLLETINTYEPSKDLMSEIKKKQPLFLLAIGDTFSFGTYEQDNDLNNGKEPIEWVVIDKSEENNSCFVISKQILDCLPYNNEREKVLWKNCSTREWLNSSFYDTAFSDAEKENILQTTVDDYGNPYYRVEGGGTTKDKLYYLSLQEINMSSYFAYDSKDYCKQLLCLATPYAIAQGVEADEEKNGPWGLRTPGAEQIGCCIVARNGLILGNNTTAEAGVGVFVDSTGLGVRPAMNIDGNYILNN